MNINQLQDLVFPKYQEFHDHYGHLPNTLVTSPNLAFNMSYLLDPETTFAGMVISVDQKLAGNEFKLGVLL